MKSIKYIVIAVLFMSCQFVDSEKYIVVKDGEFIKNGQAYKYIGTNFWYGMNLGAYDQERLIRELDRLNELGVKNLRLMAASEGNADAEWRLQPCLQTSPGVFNEELLKGLDFLLDEMSKRDMVGVMCLNNFWPWSGGMSQYVSWANNNEAIPFPPPAKDGDWRTYQEYTAQFYANKKALEYFNKLLAKVVERKNSVNGLAYKEDPTIMAWQLANEPEGMNKEEAYRNWLHETAKFIKSMDENHLVSIGSEGNTPFPQTGNDFEKDHDSEYIDYCTFHLWIQNWGFYDPLQPEESYKKAIVMADKYIKEHFDIANKLNKPVVLEEFGISRDLNSYETKAKTDYRDVYYKYIFNKVLTLSKKGNMAGANFWAWGGEGRPRFSKAVWETGDDLIGDPPHEYQGWYSVYDTDESTMAIIKEYTGLISEE
ncbi:MAG: cellulase family glycosylhydrolase [Labilibaculum sp.]|nr:cellulase family glycosylhydrolase [Labilibaculum sp.]MBI9058083.1 cellulase family glycosylhydrolase [Labilibaculum sp.]